MIIVDQDEHPCYVLYKNDKDESCQLMFEFAVNEPQWVWVTLKLEEDGKEIDRSIRIDLWELEDLLKEYKKINKKRGKKY